MKRTLRLALALLLAGAMPVSASEPAPVGDEFLAGDRIRPTGVARTMECRDGEGTVYRLTETTSDLSDPAREVRIERWEGYLELEPIELDDELRLISLQCTKAGTLLVVLDVGGEGRKKLLAFDPEGDALGSFVVERDYWDGRAYGIHDSAGIYETWTEYDGGSDQLFGRWLGYGGVARGPTVELDEPMYVSSARQVLVAGTGDVFVSWAAAREEEDVDRDVVLVRIVDKDGHLVGDVTQLNQLEGTTVWWDLDAEEERDGLFVVYWGTFEQGGRVARYFSLDPETIRPDTVTTTTLPPNETWPGFAPGRKFAVSPGDEDLEDVSLVSDGQGTFLATWWKRVWNEDEGWYADTARVVAKSTDLGRHWQQTVVDDRWGWYEAMALSATGTAVIAKAEDQRIGLVVSRDSGATWDEEHTVVPPGGEEPDSWINRVAIATDGSGTWGVVWSFEDDYADFRVTRVYVALSTDDAASWHGVQDIWQGGGDPVVDVRLATDGSGQWIAAIQTDRGHAIDVACSADDGQTWSPPERAVDVITSSPEAWDAPWRDSLSLAHLEGDHWLIVFATNQHQRYYWGADGDVFAVRSKNDGASWSEPKPVNAYAGFDGAVDTEPSLAVDLFGTPMVVWRSHESLGDRFGTDADILGATSLNYGRTWAWPEGVDAGAATDASFQFKPKLAAGNGEWLAMWRSIGPLWWIDDHDLVVAAGPSHPGDSGVDGGEQCDDGNLVSGDGCDADGSFTSCGNGVVTAGEECDDGNDDTDDQCAECHDRRCGDGFRHPPSEDCDTGATTNDGDCLSTCELARCGDGYVHVDEACDDGNTNSTDGCTTDCTTPVCGDADVWVGHEQCDDGNDWEQDACHSDCTAASCGDGYVWERKEMCEPGVAGPPHPCGGDCRFLPLCNADGKASKTFAASDSLDILRFAVGMPNDCGEAPVCDLDVSGEVSVKDALIALRMAVGLLDGICAPVQEVRLRIGTSAPMSTLQIELDFPKAIGSFFGADGRVHCTHPFNDVFLTDNELEPGRAFIAMLSNEGFASDDSAVICKFYLTGLRPVTSRDFSAWVDATGVAGEDLQPDPDVTVETP